MKKKKRLHGTWHAALPLSTFSYAQHLRGTATPRAGMKGMKIRCHDAIQRSRVASVRLSSRLHTTIDLGCGSKEGGDGLDA